MRLTPTEWQLLEVLLRNPGTLLSRRRLLQEVWGGESETTSGNLRVYMGQLRRKLESDPIVLGTCSTNRGWATDSSRDEQ